MTMITQSAKATVFLICTHRAFPLAPSSSWPSLSPVPSSSAHRGSSHRHRRHWFKLRQQLDVDKDTGIEPPWFHSANSSTHLNPLLTSFLLRSVRKDQTNNEVLDTDTNANASIRAQFTFADASRAMSGLSIWETSLRKARLPIIDDFPKDQSCWPDEPLFNHVFSILSHMGLPRLVHRHPEISTSVLLGVAKIAVQFTIAQRRGKLVISDNILDQEEDEYNTYEYNLEELNDTTVEFEFEPLTVEELENLAASLANSLGQEWGGMIQGVAQLDKVFGYDHGLLDLQGTNGFGVHDGIWKHSGWRPMPDLQRRISSIPELRELLSRLGRRPSAEGRDSRRFKDRKRSYSHDDMMGVELDILDPTSVSSLTQSGSLTQMLPSEAVLLRSSIRSLRWLFLAKKAESKLMSYELSGWADVPTLPLPRARRSKKLPSDSGGPLIICLDTSHSMSGIRENLSKAVVLASITVAHKQGRDCRIVSFSSSSNSVVCEKITCDTDGVQRLLEFLSFSFGGGTDVTGALKHAIETIENDMTSSDIILVTDGELPNPPVSDAIFTKLEQLKRNNGLEIHGLLVGRQESDSLSLLCNEVHNFLGNYDGVNVSTYTNVGSRPRPSSSLLLAPCENKYFRHLVAATFLKRSPKRQSRMILHATSKLDWSDEVNSCNMKLNKRDGKDKTQRKRLDDFDDDFDWQESEYKGYVNDGPTSKNTWESHLEKSEFTQQVEEAVSLIQDDVSKLIVENRLDVEDLEVPWSESKVLADTIEYVESGLVERDIEARLVVLGMISKEHVLFIGPPGTSKSEIGRKLSRLCGGPFFQRLFTRFTTPEEIFGPLSLRALENDEYVRNIEGYLPTATVAFLDEIFKANSAILNTLLTILNERMFDNGAGRRVSCPLKCVIGASNELPDSDELDALLDRFLLRSYVTPVSDDGLLELLSTRTPCTPAATDPTFIKSLDEVISKISIALDDITIGQNICILIRDLRTFLRDELDIYVSDRRLVKACRLLKVSAASNGRRRVDFVDCLLLQHVLWKYPEQQDTVREWLWDNMTPGTDNLVEQTQFLLQGLRAESLEMVKKTMGDTTGAAGARISDLDSISSIVLELEAIGNLLQQQHDELVRHNELLQRLSYHLWFSRNIAQATKQYLLPVAKEALVSIRQTLLDTLSLKLALTSTSIENEVRSSTIEALTHQYNIEARFTDEELQMSLKEAKKRFTGDQLRRWKSARLNFESNSR